MAAWVSSGILQGQCVGCRQATQFCQLIASLYSGMIRGLSSILCDSMIPGEVEETVGGRGRWRDLAVVRLAEVKRERTDGDLHGFLG